MAEVYKNGPVEVSFTVYEVKQALLQTCFSICRIVILKLRNVYAIVEKLKKLRSVFL